MPLPVSDFDINIIGGLIVGMASMIYLESAGKSYVFINR